MIFCRRASAPVPAKHCAAVRTASSRCTCCGFARPTNWMTRWRSATTATGCTRCWTVSTASVAPNALRRKTRPCCTRSRVCCSTSMACTTPPSFPMPRPFRAWCPVTCAGSMHARGRARGGATASASSRPSRPRGPVCRCTASLTASTACAHPRASASS